MKALDFKTLKQYYFSACHYKGLHYILRAKSTPFKNNICEPVRFFSYEPCTSMEMVLQHIANNIFGFTGVNTQNTKFFSSLILFQAISCFSWSINADFQLSLFINLWFHKGKTLTHHIFSCYSLAQS